MRSATDPPGGDRIPVVFEGHTVFGEPGQSLAAALAAVGILALGETGSGSARGVFCGMGVCQECLVLVDGVRTERACMVKLTRPLAVARHRSRPAPVEAGGLPPLFLDDVPAETPPVLVIGGGAGGLSAALAARQAGADVVLLDERGTAGGQYYKQSGVASGAPLDRQQAEGRALVGAVGRSGAAVVSGCEVWGAFPAGDAAAEIMAVGHDGTRRFRPARLIVATGAYERGLPVPGWTLPGVMTTGAAQTFWRSYRSLPGRRVLIAGNGPLNLQVACELADAGAEVVAVAESASAPRIGSLGALARMVTADAALVARGIGYRVGLAKRGVPVLYGHVVTRIERRDDGLAATLARLDGRTAGEARGFMADVVCLGYGFQPANEILRALGAAHDYDAVRGHLVTRRDDDCGTTVPGVYAVGDCCGLAGAQAAAVEGTIAGRAAAGALGFARASSRSSRRRLARTRRFEAALWALFAAPRFQHELAASDTVICRCEEVSLGRLEAALADGGPSIGEVKQRTRAGMGLCQGRYCSPVIAALLAERHGRPLDERAFFAPRLPAKPVSIAHLARLAAKPGPG